MVFDATHNYCRRQYGGEGKGLITAYLVARGDADIMIKTGDPNPAHSFGDSHSIFRVCMIPSGGNLGMSAIVFTAGCLIHVDTLLNELVALDYRDKIFVDLNAGIIDERTLAAQRPDGFYETVGSTMTGKGYATFRRVLRRLTLARDEPRLAAHLHDTKLLVCDALKCGRHVVVGGAQAYSLSNYQGEYPCVSSRDTTAGKLLAQVGLGSHYLDSIILVIKRFPTRNQGGHGAISHELTPEFVTSHTRVFDEKGGSSFDSAGRKRRFGLFGSEVVKRACVGNTPNAIALTGVDRLNALLHEPMIRKHYGKPLRRLSNSSSGRAGVKWRSSRRDRMSPRSLLD